MYIQKEYLRENIGLTLNDTYKLDLPESGTLLGLMVKIVGQMATANPTAGLNTWRPIDWMDNLSIIANGATVIKSMSFKQLAFLSAIDQKVVPPTKWLEYSQPYCREWYLLNFGRFWGDTQLGLPLEKFDSVELQIKNSLTSTYCQNLWLSLMACYLRDAPGGTQGYMRTEEWRKWTTVADETQYLNLPTEYPIRRIVFQPVPAVDATTKVSKCSFFNLMDDVELNLKTGVLRVYKGGLDDLAALNLFETGFTPMTHGIIYHTADRGFETGIGYQTGMALSAQVKTGVAATVIPTVEGDNNTCTQIMEAYTPDQPVGWFAIGQALHNCVVFPFDQDANPYTWLDPEASKVVQCNVHTQNAASAASGANILLLDRLVRL
jgi:hypothetical protein